ncbi:MAG: SBBP repeat-containing protein [Desulfurobacteriaceae bacterium]
MKKVFSISVFVFLFLISSGFSANPSLSEAQIKAKIKTIAVPFIENRGQVDGQVAYYAKTFGGTVFVTKKGELVYGLPAEKGEVALREVFVGAHVKDVKGEGKARTKVSYFRGKDRSKWVSGLSTYNYVNLGELWKSVKVKVRAYGDNVEKLFYVEPGGDVEKIRVKIEGAKSLEVGVDGRLKIVTKKGEVYFTKPVAYQEVEGKRKYVEVKYVVEGKEYGFRLGEYDQTKPVVIDPLLASTYLGGGSDDVAYALAIDGNGNVYVAGYTTSSDFPVTSGAYGTTYNGNYDVFISKFSSDLSELLASTYLGGESRDYVYALTIDGSGNVYVAGETWSSDFPVTSGAYDTNGRRYDGFISKLSSDLSELLASTHLGGREVDVVHALAIDGNGNVYVAGETWSSDFPVTSGAYDTTKNDSCYYLVVMVVIMMPLSASLVVI